MAVLSPILGKGFRTRHWVSLGCTKRPLAKASQFLGLENSSEEFQLTHLLRLFPEGVCLVGGEEAQGILKGYFAGSLQMASAFR